MTFPLPPEGRGFSADDLHRVQLDNARERLARELPKLKERAVSVIAASKRAERDMAALRLELSGALGGDGLKLAIEALDREAEAKLKADDMAAALAAKQAVEAPAHAPTVPSTEAPVRQAQTQSRQRGAQAAQ